MAAEVLEFVPDGSRKCTSCGQVKPLVDFPPVGGSKSGTRTRKCRRCTTDQAYQRNRAKPDVVETKKVRNRAYQRTKARGVEWLQAEFPDRWNAWFTEELAAAKAEAAQMEPGAKLLPGPKAKHEVSAVDRIAEICSDCSKHHVGGHACDVCGSKPGEPANTVPMDKFLETGEIRLQRTKATVIQP